MWYNLRVYAYVIRRVEIRSNHEKKETLTLINVYIIDYAIIQKAENIKEEIDRINVWRLGIKKERW